MHSFLWHDYETFGAVARRDRPAQFAAVRTDADLNELGEPINIFCRPANDYLPDPQSCLITHITPQQCLEQGLPEYQFAAQIEQALSASGTIGVGYNTIRFDDEVTRFLFWRNLIDPYAREWQNQCGRWDIMDMLRTCYALRPDGIVWPLNDEGKPSFRLEHLTAANGISHESAHDALSDVRATVALARLVKQKQPRLFDFCFSLHKKDKVAQELGVPLLGKAFLHVSGMFPTNHGCLAIMWPLAVHPKNKNEIIAWDLRYDPEELVGLSIATIQERLFSKISELAERVTRLPIKSVHLNKSPIVIGNLKTLSAEMAARWQIDVEQAHNHAQKAAQLQDQAALPNELWDAVFGRSQESTNDVDEDLYGGFLGPGDRRLLNELRSYNAADLIKANPHFQDERLDELFFRYKARNFAEHLNEEEALRWEEHRYSRLIEGAGNARNVDAYFDQIDQLSETADEVEQDILGALYDYAEMIVPVR
ncbi:exodeoxyribonuclease I [Undibacterium cyanobacteriorum]|uniref:Exodeoxyribonuclease I n=1 Tax=Undibacterium cyanobacteriorum TaxID=3073561 RepID=A0ABY9RJ29_9BURK|nr:exodeoxyribonuclease I [Undibacterium sp. 20NA77.5]WMW81231.1 exodeoxyribonuclease I [Undibacterium sp. 20NA77.5]